MSNALIMILAGAAIWGLLIASVCALVSLDRHEHDDDERLDTIRDELDRQEMKPRRVRAGV